MSARTPLEEVNACLQHMQQMDVDPGLGKREVEQAPKDPINKDGPQPKHPPPQSKGQGGQGKGGRASEQAEPSSASAPPEKTVTEAAPEDPLLAAAAAFGDRKSQPDPVAAGTGHQRQQRQQGWKSNQGQRRGWSSYHWQGSQQRRQQQQQDSVEENLKIMARLLSSTRGRVVPDEGGARLRPDDGDAGSGRSCQAIQLGHGVEGEEGEAGGGLLPAAVSFSGPAGLVGQDAGVRDAQCGGGGAPDSSHRAGLRADAGGDHGASVVLHALEPDLPGHGEGCGHRANAPEPGGCHSGSDPGHHCGTERAATIPLYPEDGGHVRRGDGHISDVGGTARSHVGSSMGNADQSLWKWFRKGYRPQNAAGQDGSTTDRQSAGGEIPATSAAAEPGPTGWRGLGESGGCAEGGRAPLSLRRHFSYHLVNRSNICY